jgi:hypothetical protein
MQAVQRQKKIDKNEEKATLEALQRSDRKFTKEAGEDILLQARLAKVEGDMRKDCVRFFVRVM